MLLVWGHSEWTTPCAFTKGFIALKWNVYCFSVWVLRILGKVYSRYLLIFIQLGKWFFYFWYFIILVVLHSKPVFQFSLVTQLCLTLCGPMDSTGFPVHHQLLELAQTHAHWVGDAIQPSHPLSSPSPPAFNLSQHQGLFQWVSSLHQVAKVLELQLQHQSFQWIFRIDFL